MDPLESDLMEIGGLFNVVLACRTAGIDFNWDSINDRQRLRYFLHQFALGGAIDAAKEDPEVIKAQMRKVFAEFPLGVHDRVARGPGVAGGAPGSGGGCGPLI